MSFLLARERAHHQTAAPRDIQTSHLSIGFKSEFIAMPDRFHASTLASWEAVDLSSIQHFVPLLGLTLLTGYFGAVADPSNTSATSGASALPATNRTTSPALFRTGNVMVIRCVLDFSTQLVIRTAQR
jgi:hypothetical protein